MAGSDVVDQHSLISESARRACRGDFEPVRANYVVSDLFERFANTVCMDENYIWVIATAIITAFITFAVMRRILGNGMLAPVRGRYTNLFLGLPSSGKTSLVSRLCTVNNSSTAETQTSIVPSVEAISGVTVVDYPGHRRLRTGINAFLADAKRVFIVIDSVTIHDDKHDGAHAIAELILTVAQCAAFSGIHELIFVCTKRDEVTSYAAKAIRKLLEAALAASISSRQGNLGSVDKVRDGSGNVVGKHRNVKNSGADRRGGVSLELEEDGSFHLEQLGVPVNFVEVSSFPSSEHNFNVEPVLDIVLDC